MRSNRPRTLDEAYERLDLVDLDDHLREMAHRNPDYSRIGATTWMIVEALIAVRDSRLHNSTRPVVILCTRDDEGPIVEELIDLYLRGWDIPIKSTERGVIRFVDGYDIRVGAFVNAMGRPIVFDDAKWKRKAIRRSMGPYGEIRSTLRKDGRWKAYDGYGKFVLELTEEGVETLRNHPGFEDVDILQGVML